MKRGIRAPGVVLGILIYAASVSWAEEPQQTILESAALSKRGIYQAKDYSYLYGMQGFSEALLNMHFRLYQAYVNNTNQIAQRLQELEIQQLSLSPEYGALKHRLGWEWDGMRLHEYYFENLGGKKPLDAHSALYQKLVEHFASYEAWKSSFIATGLMRGIGWVILYQDSETGRLFNAWINEHDVGHLAGGTPLLIMDVFEHAYITQYGLNKRDYIEAFFVNIDWDRVSKRLSQGSISSHAPYHK